MSDESSQETIDSEIAKEIEQEAQHLRSRIDTMLDRVSRLQIRVISSK